MNYGPANFYEDNKRHVRLSRPVTRRRIPKPVIQANHAPAIATLKDLVNTSGISLHAIIRAMCIVNDVAGHEFFGPTRGARKTADARQVYYYLARELLQASYPEIGKRIGRDHTSVLHGYRKIGANLAKYADMISAAKKLLGVE